jgi:hypothetical protein
MRNRSCAQLWGQCQDAPPSTAAQIEHLLSLLDEIAPYYAQNQQAETLNAETLKGSSGKTRD